MTYMSLEITSWLRAVAVHTHRVNSFLSFPLERRVCLFHKHTHHFISFHFLETIICRNSIEYFCVSVSRFSNSELLCIRFNVIEKRDTTQHNVNFITDKRNLYTHTHICVCTKKRRNNNTKNVLPD